VPVRTVFENPTLGAFIDAVAEMRGGHAALEETISAVRELDGLSDQEIERLATGG